MTFTRAEIKRRYRERHGDRIKAARAARQPDRNCADCGEWSVHEALGLCRKCYKKVAGQRPGPKAVGNARTAAWTEVNREHVRQYFIDRRLNDPEWAAGRRAYYRQYVADHAVEKRAAVKDWQKAHPDMVRAAAKRRRVRLRGNEATLTAQDWVGILIEFGNRCAYCGASGPMTQDHMQPISRGGSHTRTNVVPACPRCNSSKGASTAAEYLARLEFDAGLTRRQIQVRALLSEGLSLAAIGRQLGCTPENVARIRNRIAYKAAQ